MDRGLHQNDIAKEIGVSVCTITNWELGHTKPKSRYTPEIARFLGCVDDTDGRSALSARAPALALFTETGKEHSK